MNRRTTSKRKIRYAVVGLGHIAQVAILPAFRNATNSELIAVVSGESEKREKLARKYHLEHAYSYDQYDRALSQVDAVYLALPNHLHRDYAIRAAQARVQVIADNLSNQATLDIPNVPIELSRFFCHPTPESHVGAQIFSLTWSTYLHKPT